MIHVTTYQRLSKWIFSIVLLCMMSFSAIPKGYFASYTVQDPVEMYDFVDYKSEVEKDNNEQEDHQLRSAPKHHRSIHSIDVFVRFKIDQHQSLYHPEILTPPPKSMLI